jgi:hypothetical protein
VGRYQEAAQDYELLVKIDPLDTQAIAGPILIMISKKLNNMKLPY